MNDKIKLEELFSEAARQKELLSTEELRSLIETSPIPSGSFHKLKLIKGNKPMNIILTTAAAAAAVCFIGLGIFNYGDVADNKITQSNQDTKQTIILKSDKNSPIEQTETKQYVKTIKANNPQKSKINVDNTIDKQDKINDENQINIKGANIIDLDDAELNLLGINKTIDDNKSVYEFTAMKDSISAIVVTMNNTHELPIQIYIKQKVIKKIADNHIKPKFITDEKGYKLMSLFSNALIASYISSKDFGNLITASVSDKHDSSKNKMIQISSVQEITTDDDSVIKIDSIINQTLQLMNLNGNNNINLSSDNLKNLKIKLNDAKKKIKNMTYKFSNYNLNETIPYSSSNFKMDFNAIDSSDDSNNYGDDFENLSNFDSSETEFYRLDSLDSDNDSIIINNFQDVPNVTNMPNMTNIPKMIVIPNMTNIPKMSKMPAYNFKKEYKFKYRFDSLPNISKFNFDTSMVLQFDSIPEFNFDSIPKFKFDSIPEFNFDTLQGRNNLEKLEKQIEKLKKLQFNYDSILNNYVNINKMVPIGIRIDKSEPSNHYDYILWYEPTDSLIDRLPERVQLRLDPEIQALKTKNYCSQKPADANNAVFDIWRSCSGAIENLQAYPNPSSGFLNIKYNLISDRKISIILNDLTGRKVCEISPAKLKTAGLHEESFVIKDIDPGMYFITLQSENSEQAVQRIIFEK